MRKDVASEIFVYITFQLFAEHNLVIQLQKLHQLPLEVQHAASLRCITFQKKASLILQ